MTKPQHEQDSATVLEEMETLGKSWEGCCDRCHYRSVDADALAALTRLAAEAAKVPGLEAERVASGEKERDLLKSIENLHCTLEGVQEGSVEWGWNLVAAGLERCDLLIRAAKNNHDAMVAAESERDAARQERDTVAMQRTREIEAKGAHIKRALDAEARVKELTEQLAGARVAALEEVATAWDARRRNGETELTAADIRLMKSQPPPAPAQGDAKRGPRAEEADRLYGVVANGTGPIEPEAFTALGALRDMAEGATPTPPALVEAVGHVRAIFAGSHAEVEEPKNPAGHGSPVWHWRKALALLAAYDAAKGGEVKEPTCPKCGHAAHWEHGTASRAPQSYCSRREGWSAQDCGCVHTPPSGPGGGEPKDAAFESWARSQQEADEQRREWARAQRPRQPESDVPALKAEPAGPEVVWTGEFLKVDAQGTVYDNGRVNSDSHTIRALARALAEAKRELEGMRGERDAERQIAQEWEAKAHEAVNGAGGWRDVVTAEEHLKGEAFQRAAESMRERAAKAVDAIIDDLSDRAGLGNEWDQIDSEIQEDIRTKWKALILVLPLETP